MTRRNPKTESRATKAVRRVTEAFKAGVLLHWRGPTPDNRREDVGTAGYYRSGGRASHSTGTAEYAIFGTPGRGGRDATFATAFGAADHLVEWIGVGNAIDALKAAARKAGTEYANLDTPIRWGGGAWTVPQARIEVQDRPRRNPARAPGYNSPLHARFGPALGSHEYPMHMARQAIESAQRLAADPDASLTASIAAKRRARMWLESARYRPTLNLPNPARRNPARAPGYNSPSGWEVARRWFRGFRQDQPIVYSKAGHPNVEQNTQGTWFVAGHKVSTVYSSVADAMAVAETMQGDAYGQMKPNPARRPKRRRNPPKGTPTSMNVVVMADALHQGNGLIPARVPSVDVASLKRCIAAGYLEGDRNGFRVTPAGLAAIAANALAARVYAEGPRYPRFNPRRGR